MALDIFGDKKPVLIFVAKTNIGEDGQLLFDYNDKAIKDFACPCNRKRKMATEMAPIKNGNASGWPIKTAFLSIQIIHDYALQHDKEVNLIHICHKYYIFRPILAQMLYFCQLPFK